ncbi:hypothetical protein ACFV8E_06070 [Streptomyces sp. NPDC059849]|uniref:hypothetical protein n=1 Tax=unclassified Streptomyces TaxID=2593676 RepID=UPI00364DE34A
MGLGADGGSHVAHDRGCRVGSGEQGGDRRRGGERPARRAVGDQAEPDPDSVPGDVGHLAQPSGRTGERSGGAAKSVTSASAPVPYEDG